MMWETAFQKMSFSPAIRLSTSSRPVTGSTMSS